VLTSKVLLPGNDQQADIEDFIWCAIITDLFNPPFYIGLAKW
jgi:hypothetical protein